MHLLRESVLIKLQKVKNTPSPLTGEGWGEGE
jgi:hypothetical protein